MNTSRSLDVSGTAAFKTLQLQFLNWAAHWANAGDKMEQHPIDLPDLVQLLQALGFHIRRMDGCLPDETFSLRENEKGIRVVITCNHSGHRCYLEQPLNEDMCKCTKVSNDDSQDSFWEILATKPSVNQGASVVETGSDLIPSLSKELRQIIYSVTNYLVHMLHGHGEATSVSAAAREPAEKEDVPKRYSDQHYSIQQPADRTIVKAASSMYDVTKKPIVLVSSPRTSTDSPTRYRSLDTLTSKGADTGFPEPGSLSAMYSISESETSGLSGSNTHLSVDDVDGDSKSTIEESQASGKALPFMKRALRDLLKAISLMEANNADVSSESVFENHLKRNIKSSKIAVSSPSESAMAMRSASSPSLSKSNSLAVKQLQRNSTRLASKSTSCVKSVTKTRKIEMKRSGSVSGVEDVKPNIPVKPGLAGQAMKRTSNLYAHIKSTIPKPSLSKKK